MLLLLALTMQVGLAAGASAHRAPPDADRAMAVVAALSGALCLADGTDPAQRGPDHPGCCWSHAPAAAEVPDPAALLLFPPRPLRAPRRRLAPPRRVPVRRAVPLSDISPGAPPRCSA